jgi:hypothetical protein
MRRTPLAVLLLASFASSASAEIITGAGAGAPPHVKAFSSTSGAELASFFAFDPGFTGGVRVGAGDVDNDGLDDIITGAGPGGGPHVKVFDGTTGASLHDFLAYEPRVTSIFVAGGDVTGDSFADVVTGVDAGFAPHVKVFSGQNGAEVRSFFAYEASFVGGVRVAAGDVNGDGRDDIITAAGPGAGPHVKVFDGATGAELRSFFAYTPSFAGGVYVAAGDVTGDGRADLVTGADADAAAGGGHVKVFDGATGAEVRSFFAYNANFLGGVRVAAGDVDGDGRADIITGAGAGAQGHVKVFNGQTGAEIRSFFAYGPNFTGGVYVASSTFVPEPASSMIASLAAFALLRWRRKPRQFG